MYEAFCQHSDFIKANIIFREDENGRLEGYHQRINGINVVYQVAQMYHVAEKTEIHTFPLPEKIVDKLQLSLEELQTLAAENLKRFSLLQKEEMLLETRRRYYGKK